MDQMFNNPYARTETWSVQGAAITYGQGSESGETTSGSSFVCPLILTSLQMQFSRTIQRFYPIAGKQGAMTRYNILGAPNGTLNTQSMFGPTVKMQDFVNVVTAPCKTAGKEVWMQINPFGEITCTSESNVTTTLSPFVFKLTGLDMESFGLAIQGGEITVVQMPMSFTFTGLYTNLGS